MSNFNPTPAWWKNTITTTPIFTSNSTNVNYVNYVSTNPNPNLIGPPHILKIINYAEDYGQDDYHEEYDWDVIHPHECMKSVVYLNPIMMERMKPEDVKIADYRYECEMAKELKQNGLQNLEMKWTDLEVGEFQIGLESIAQYYHLNPGQIAQPPVGPLFYRIRLL